MAEKVRGTYNAGRVFGGQVRAADVVFTAAAGFLAGTLVFGLNWDIIVAIFVAAAVFIVFKIRAIIALAAIGGILFGSLYCGVYIHIRAAQTKLPRGTGKFSVIVADEPEAAASGKSLIIPAMLEKPYMGAVTIFAPPGEEYRYGDELLIQGEVEQPEQAAAPGDAPAIFPTKITLVAHDKGSWLREQLLDFKMTILGKFSGAFASDGLHGADEAALLGGETLGGTVGMSAALKTAMASSGTSYVVSMYGYKIAMIVFALEAALASWLARRWRFISIAAAILLFVVMSGGNVSVVRAAVMTTLALIARISGRVFDPRNTLVLVAAGMALFNPMLSIQAGFELSFLSVAGIMYLARPLENILNRFFAWPHDPGFLGWREAVIIAVASLLPIIPVVAVAFGDFSLTAFPSNILISFGVLPALLLGVALAIAGFLSVPLAFLFAKLASIVLAYQFAVINLCAAIVIPLPFSFDSTWAFAAYFAALALFILKYQ